MSEDKKYSDNDSVEESYQFSDEEYVSSEAQEHAPQDDESVQNKSEEHTQSTEQAEPESHETFFSSLAANWRLALEKFPILNNKRILFVIGAVLFLIIFLNVLHIGGKSTTKAKEIAQAQPTQVAPGFAQSEPLDNRQLQLHAQISQLKQAQNERSANMDHLQEKISNLQASVDSSNSQQAAMIAAIKKLTNYVVHVDKQVRINKNKIFPQPKSAIRKVVFKPIVYHLKAAIPGRVWLKGSNDLTITVAVGNTISPTYGKVIAIDLIKGTVITSSGRDITYGRDDN